jgi:hypothetical protein
VSRLAKYLVGLHFMIEAGDDDLAEEAALGMVSDAREGLYLESQYQGTDLSEVIRVLGATCLEFNEAD